MLLLECVYYIKDLDFFFCFLFFKRETSGSITAERIKKYIINVEAVGIKLIYMFLIDTYILKNNDDIVLTSFAAVRKGFLHLQGHVRICSDMPS